MASAPGDRKEDNDQVERYDRFVHDAKAAMSDGLELVVDSASSKAEDVAAGLKKSSRSTIISLMTVLTLVGGAIWLFKQRRG